MSSTPAKPETRQLEVQIMGQSYLLACPVGGESALLEAVERVDTAMCRIRDAGKVKARDRIAVLASLNLAFELSQLERKTAEREAEDQQFQAPRGPAGNSPGSARHTVQPDARRRHARGRVGGPGGRRPRSRRPAPLNGAAPRAGQYPCRAPSATAGDPRDLSPTLQSAASAVLPGFIVPATNAH